MLMNEIENSILDQLRSLQKSTQIDEEALNSIFDFSSKYFSIGSQYLYDNNDMISSAYNRVQIDKEFLNSAIDVWNAENPYDVSSVELPEHALTDDLLAVVAYRKAIREINSYMSGGHFRTSTFKSMMNSVKISLGRIRNRCLEKITYLECIEYCANRLKEYGIASRDWKFLAGDWKDVAIYFNPERETEAKYLERKPYLKDPKYLKRMM